MKKILLLSTVMALFCFSPVLAQGPYVGFGLDYNNPFGSDIDYLDPGLGLDFTFGYNFGPVALEGNIMGSRHDDTDPGYNDADFSGFSFNMRIYLSHLDDPNQFYLLAGLGSYSIEEFDPFEGAETELKGTGWNLGAGLEHYLNENAALDVGVVYRIIRYDEFEIGNVVYSLDPDEDGDTLSLHLGLNFHF
jgi:opacity protein-like surface antigen